MKLLREPLLHFLLLGAAIFAAFSLLSRHKVDKPGEIVITQGTLENLVTGFTRTWQRPPTQEELQGLGDRSRARRSSVSPSRRDGSRPGRHHRAQTPSTKTGVPFR